MLYLQRNRIYAVCAVKHHDEQPCMSIVFYSFRLGLYVGCCVNVVKHVLQYVQLNILALCSRMHYTPVSNPLWGSQENLRQFRKSFSGPLESRLVASQEKYFQKFDPKSEYLGKSERSHFGCVGWNLAISGIWMPAGILVIFPYLNRIHHWGGS